MIVGCVICCVRNGDEANKETACSIVDGEPAVGVAARKVATGASLRSVRLNFLLLCVAKW